ncbi:class I adenylate-forming enzyme family protein [Allosphingosinicella sp.]|uniref:class I adenylate-forming enzyme family protein n=1 Tax=Allosphingosinicella sp. TaxID=2823234 RepID=UPI003784EC9C
MIDGFALDPAWPHMTLPEVDAALTAPGARFEMENVTIRGVPTRTWKNAPPSLPMLARFSRLHGDRLITIFEDERVSYEANFRASAAIAVELRRRGVGKGDRVALAMVNLPEWVPIFFAITALGAIAVPLNAWWTGPELEYGLADSGACALLCDRARHERIAPHLVSLPELKHVIVSRAEAGDRLEALIGSPNDWKDLPAIDFPEADVLPDDPATIFYTSGTTGKPKGALGTHRNLMTNILSTGFTQARAALRRGEQPAAAPVPKVGLLVIPLFHVTACSASLMGSMVAGNTSIFMRRWDTVEAMEIIQRERVQVTGGVPTIAWQILEHPDRARYDLSSLETISYGGAPSAPELAKRIYAEFGALPGNGWGMTETMGTVTAHLGEDYLNRPDSAGPPVPVSDLKIVAADGVTELPAGEVGELWARGPQIVIGYWNKPEASAETFIQGWVRTGDLARVDEEGFLTLVDRAKDMIIRGGENIYSIEVENVLYEYPGVVDAALIGIPHHTLGEEPAAVVQLAPGVSATEDDLKAWVKGRLAIFKTPVRIVFLDHPLPRNANGKILKKDLKALFA